MNKPKHECGSCTWWTKWKNDELGRGLCDLLDYATRAQDGKDCDSWKGKKYKRNKMPA
jgi:hypothetical protein